MKVSEYLSNARNTLAQGWRQHEYSDPQGNVCAYGAVYAADGQDVYALDWVAEDTPSVIEASRHLEKKVKELGLGCLLSFNDQPSTTQQDMLNLFDKTIIGLEEKGL